MSLNDLAAAAAAAKSLQSCPTLCDPIDGSPPGSTVPGILQARTLEWVAISFSNAWKWKAKVKLLSRLQVLATHGLQPTRLFRPWDFPGKSTGVGCHCLLWNDFLEHHFVLFAYEKIHSKCHYLKWSSLFICISFKSSTKKLALKGRALVGLVHFFVSPLTTVLDIQEMLDKHLCNRWMSDHVSQRD